MRIRVGVNLQPNISTVPKGLCGYQESLQHSFHTQQPGWVQTLPWRIVHCTKRPWFGQIPQYANTQGCSMQIGIVQKVHWWNHRNHSMQQFVFPFKSLNGTFCTWLSTANGLRWIATKTSRIEIMVSVIALILHEKFSITSAIVWTSLYRMTRRIPQGQQLEPMVNGIVVYGGISKMQWFVQNAIFGRSKAARLKHIGSSSLSIWLRLWCLSNWCIAECMNSIGIAICSRDTSMITQRSWHSTRLWCGKSMRNIFTHYSCLCWVQIEWRDTCTEWCFVHNMATTPPMHWRAHIEHCLDPTSLSAWIAWQKQHCTLPAIVMVERWQRLLKLHGTLLSKSWNGDCGIAIAFERSVLDWIYTINCTRRCSRTRNCTTTTI